MPDAELMTLPETAAKARITQRTLLSHIAAGKGPTITKLGRRTLIRADHFQEWLDRNACSGGRAAA